MANIRYLAKGKRIFLYFVLSRLALVLTQSSIQWISGALSPRVKWLGHETDHSPACSAEVKNSGAAPPLTSTRLCSAYLIKHRDSFAYVTLIQ
jgi:hypothetical protein